MTYTIHITTHYIMWTHKQDIKSTQSRTLQSITQQYMTFDIGINTLHMSLVSNNSKNLKADGRA